MRLTSHNLSLRRRMDTQHDPQNANRKLEQRECFYWGPNPRRRDAQVQPRLGTSRDMAPARTTRRTAKLPGGSH